jgi:signal transduction histidine kinase
VAVQDKPRAPPPDGEATTRATATEARPLGGRLDDELRLRSTAILSTMTAVFVPILLLWGLLDHTLVPEATPTLVGIRVVVASVSVAATVWARRGGPARSFEGTMVVLLAFGLGVSAMLPFTRAALLPYAMGTTITLVGIGVLPTWPTRWAAVAIGVSGSAAIGALALATHGLTVGDVVTSATVLVTGAAVGLFAAHWKYRLAQESYDARAREVALSAALREARDAALEAAEAKSAFFAAVSHEIRTPLAAIVGYAQFLAEVELDAEPREWVAGVQSASTLMLELVNDVLDFSKLEAGKLTLEPQPVDLSALSQATLALVAPRARAQGLTLSIDVAKGVPARVFGDPVRL